jgi:hypothetical protein
MIKTLTITGEFGYIVDKIEEPACPVRGYNEKITSSRIRNLSEK